MITDAGKIESIIYEEIQRYLKELTRGEKGTTSSSPPGSNNQGQKPIAALPSSQDQAKKEEPQILFLLPPSIDQELALACALPDIIKRYPGAYVHTRILPNGDDTPSGSITSPFSQLVQWPRKTDKLNNDYLFKIGDIKALILMQPPLSLLAQVALGSPFDEEPLLLLQALAEGKSVFAVSSPSPVPPLLLSSPLSSSSSEPLRSLQSLYRNYKKTLENWGLVWLRPEELFSAVREIMEKPPSIAPRTNIQADTQKRIIITGEDVQERIQRGEKQWIIPQNAIVTCIAVETAQHNGFVLKRNK